MSREWLTVRAFSPSLGQSRRSQAGAKRQISAEHRTFKMTEGNGSEREKQATQPMSI